MLVISEAAIRLEKLGPVLAGSMAPHIDWAGIRGMGNFIRHKYDDLDSGIIIAVIEHRLMELKIACEEALKAFDGT